MPTISPKAIGRDRLGTVLVNTSSSRCLCKSLPLCYCKKKARSTREQEPASLPCARGLGKWLPVQPRHASVAVECIVQVSCNGPPALWVPLGCHEPTCQRAGVISQGGFRTRPLTNHISLFVRALKDQIPVPAGPLRCCFVPCTLHWRVLHRQAISVASKVLQLRDGNGRAVPSGWPQGCEAALLSSLAVAI